jgi:hypothetical protein
VSFGTHARKVRDPGRPHGSRVSMLRSCVQLYRPIGFHATLGFLEQIAGAVPDPRDRADPRDRRAHREPGAMEAAVGEYAQRRTSAKRHGQRSPHPREGNPHPPRWWYGAPRQGALHALTCWSRERLPELLAAYPDRAARDIDACVAACLATAGELPPEDRDRLQRPTDTVAHRLTSDLYHDDPLEYFQVGTGRAAGLLNEGAAQSADVAWVGASTRPGQEGRRVRSN